MRVLSRLFRRLFLEKLIAAHDAGRLQFFGDHAHLADAQAFAAYLAPLRRTEWVVYAKRPFGGPEAVLAYLSRYTHRVAISNSRLIAFDDNGVTFKWKDYRAKGRERHKMMTLATDEFIRRFLIHVLPDGFHRIRHYGLFASGARAENIARARELLAVPHRQHEAADADASADGAEPQTPSHPCPCCGGRMIIIETFERGCSPRTRPAKRDQDRHVMMTIATSQYRNARRPCRSSIGHGGARSNMQLAISNRAPICRSTHRRARRNDLLSHRNVADQCARSTCRHSHTASAALKSP